MGSRNQFTAEFKTKLVLKVFREEKQIGKIATGINGKSWSTHHRERLAKQNLTKCLGPTGRLNLVSKEDKLSVFRQCELLKISRTSIYYTPVEPDRERENEIKNRLTKRPYLLRNLDINWFGRLILAISGWGEAICISQPSSTGLAVS